MCCLQKKEETNMFKVLDLKNEAEKESYDYFDKNIRKLKGNESGKITESLVDNDLDAFRHAYTSGVFTLEKGVNKAAFYGYLNELTGGNGSSSSNSDAAKNMDFWNNAVGRKYGQKASNREELLQMIHNALKNGELIIDLNDTRQYDDDFSFKVDTNKPVIVIKESKTGRNELFLDTLQGVVMDRESFVSQIESGSYPGYQVALIDNLSTPMSKPDGDSSNNLG